MTDDKKSRLLAALTRLMPAGDAVNPGNTEWDGLVSYEDDEWFVSFDVSIESEWVCEPDCDDAPEDWTLLSLGIVITDFFAAWSDEQGNVMEFPENDFAGILEQLKEDFYSSAPTPLLRYYGQ